jgi:hypothetical protein
LDIVNLELKLRIVSQLFDLESELKVTSKDKSKNETEISNKSSISENSDLILRCFYDQNCNHVVQKMFGFLVICLILFYYLVLKLFQTSI